MTLFTYMYAWIDSYYYTEGCDINSSIFTSYQDVYIYISLQYWGTDRTLAT